MKTLTIQAAHTLIINGFHAATVDAQGRTMYHKTYAAAKRIAGNRKPVLVLDLVVL